MSTFFADVAKTLGADLGQNLLDKTGDFIGQITPLFVACFSFYVLLETFAKFLFPRQPKPKHRFSSISAPQSLLILPKYPLNPPRIPDNQASRPPFRQQQAHLAC